MGGGVARKRHKNKGFTLAELLAVITILGVIALIVFPAVNKSIKNSKEKSYNQQVESILESAENWTLENMSSLSDISDNYITIGELQQSGYLEAKKVINPKTDEEMNGCIVIKYDESYNQYTYRYDDESCSDVAAVPIITLNGDTTITIGKDETFTDPGYTATYKDNDVTSSVVVTGEVDTSLVGTYTLEYSVSYDGKSAKKYRTVNVVLIPKTFTEVMTGNSEVSSLDPDSNLRYVGADPDNYVWFNEELWRIVGIFDGQVKIRKKLTYNSTIAFDLGSSSGGTHGTSGYNDWNQATLQSELNETYLTSIKSNDLESYNYIDLTHEWNIGGIANYSSATSAELYNAERSETISSVMTVYKWTGAIGLMYPSDYKYGGAWLLSSNSSSGHWTMTPDTSGTSSVLIILPNNSVYNGTASGTTAATPVLYLKENVAIVDGTGTDIDPFILGLK